MNDYEFDNLIRESLKIYGEQYIDINELDLKKHSFSRSFKKKMKTLIKIQSESPSFTARRISLGKLFIIILTAIVLSANTISMVTLGENLFSLIVTRDSGGFRVDFNGDYQDNNQDYTISENSIIENDPYGMIAKCAEYGVYPDTPLYIPDGFELDHIDIDESPHSMVIRFFYKKEKIILNFDFESYYNCEDILSPSIPSDEYNISEVEVNGTKGITSKEKNSLNKVTDQYTLIYCKGNVVYMIYSDGLDYDECDKITESMTSNPLKGGEKNEETVFNNVIVNFVLPVFANLNLCY